MPVDLELQPFLSEAQKRFPRLKRFDFNIVKGEGPGFAEFFPSEERGNPFPGSPTIQIRPQAFERNFDIANVIAGDALHELGQNDPEFSALREKFAESLNSDQMRFAQQVFQNRQNDPNHPETRSFQQFFEVSWLDALIRGGITPDEDDNFNQISETPGAMFTPENRKVLEEMRQLLEQE